MRLNKKLIFKELLLTVVFILFLWGSVRALMPLYKVFKQEYFYLPFAIGTLITPVLFGMLLGIPSLIERWESNNGFNWLKLIVQGLPALVLTIPPILIVRIFNISFNFNYFPWMNMQSLPPGSALILHLSGIWFGKVLIDCIKGDKRYCTDE
ncbi:MAG: hypothetical protein K6T65_11400 [Peptococcaceae bacterium]|nr:hypothetical protein [Peptococcaceae bacterium]